MDHQDQIKALLLPFARGVLPRPERCFLLRAEPSEDLADWRERLVCEQGFKPAFDALARAGFKVAERLDGTFPAGLCLITKHKAESLANIARAWSLLEPGGILVCAGPNALGAASIEREVEVALGLDDRLSKHQCRVFWLRRQDGGAMPPALAAWAEAARPARVDGDGRWVARAGSFSSAHVDKGSRLLVDCLPATLAGRGADLGAGWGYLAAEILDRCPAVESVDLFEAEAGSLEDARTNLAGQGARAAFHWQDVRSGLPDVAPYDWIVSNPPFHEGRRADPAIGRDFITAAWKAIRRRGKFILVANQSLPYEGELRRRFREVELQAAQDGFKVYLCSNRHDR